MNIDNPTFFGLTLLFGAVLKREAVAPLYCPRRKVHVLPWALDMLPRHGTARPSSLLLILLAIPRNVFIALLVNALYAIITWSRKVVVLTTRKNESRLRPLTTSSRTKLDCDKWVERSWSCKGLTLSLSLTSS